ncbi:hypothetical protein PGT21_006463 [Puccinia graminis f. sp. tritici]|uniref:Uncharacterized protein n=1 Tax=Puccinia graminis f. sp. tritici TaxID=56615 RepID=A0A5B0Q2T7_PUCGR|nr:hypothetical protein PGT21_006463 [Puccinia graminis f. sp. tritici]
MPPSHWQPPWVVFAPVDSFASAPVSSINNGLASVFPIFPHQFTSPPSFINFHSNLQYFLHIVSQAVLCHLAPAITMSSNNSNVPSSDSSTPVEIPAPQGYQTISNPTPAEEDGYRIYPERGKWSPLFVPKAETPRAADIPVDDTSVVQNGIRYYPERGDWSPLFVPNAETPCAADIPVNPMTDPGVEPAGMAANAPVVSMADHDTDMEATVPENASVDPCPPPVKTFPAPIPLPYGMELIQTGTHFLPQKEKWQSLYDPARNFDLSTIPDKVPVPRGFIDPHPFCDPVFQNPPPGLVLPAFNPLMAANIPSHAPGAHPASASSSTSDASTYPPLSEYLHLGHKDVQDLLSKKNLPPDATCLYTEEDVMRIFEGIAPEFVWLCDDFPPHTLNEFDRRVIFFENMQWHFKCKKSTYLSTRNF